MQYLVTFGDGLVRKYSRNYVMTIAILRRGVGIERNTMPEVGDLVADFGDCPIEDSVLDCMLKNQIGTLIPITHIEVVE